MVGIDPNILAIMPAALAFRVNTWVTEISAFPGILRSHQARLGGDEYQPKIVPQRIKQQEIISTGMNFNRGSKRRTDFSLAT